MSGVVARGLIIIAFVFSINSAIGTAEASSALDLTLLGIGELIDASTTNTTSTWSPGSPKFVVNQYGQFALVLANSPPSHWLYSLIWLPTGSATWEVVAYGVGPAASAPVLLTDSLGRLHVITPQEGNYCDSSHGNANLRHVIYYLNNWQWQTYEVATAPIFADARSCFQAGNPDVTRVGATVHGNQNVIYLIYEDARAPSGYIENTATFNLSSLVWSQERPVTPLPSLEAGLGVGYTYIAPSSLVPGEISVIATIYNQTGVYTDLYFLRSSDSGTSWESHHLCEAGAAGATLPPLTQVCYTGDLLHASNNKVYFTEYVDTTVPGAGFPSSPSPYLPNAAQVYLVDPSNFSFHPVVDPNFPFFHPGANTSLNELNGKLVVLSAFWDFDGVSKLGMWASEDEGQSWAFTNLNPYAPNNPVRKLYDTVTYKPQFGGITDTSSIWGFLADIFNTSAVVSYSFQLQNSPLDFSSSSLSVSAGQYTTLSLSAPGMQSCVISGGAYGSGQNTSLPTWSGWSGILQQTTTFAILCTDSLGLQHGASVTVQVSGG